MRAMLKERLRQARQAQGWTLDDVAGRLSPVVTRSTVSHWEAGRSRPKRDNLFQLARILAVTVEWLNGESNDGGPGSRPVMRRELLRRVEVALETYLQTNDLVMDPPDRWEAVESVYDWAEDAEQESGPDQLIRIESVRAFLRRVRPRSGV